MSEFQTVCKLEDLIPNSGVAALIDGQQVALFYIDEQVFATGNYDPIGKANVLSRGIVGDVKGQLVVASPLYKEHYNLITGQCLEDESQSIPVHEVKLETDQVLVKLAAQ